MESEGPPDEKEKVESSEGEGSAVTAETKESKEKEVVEEKEKKEEDEKEKTEEKKEEIEEREVEEEKVRPERRRYEDYDYDDDDFFDDEGTDYGIGEGDEGYEDEGRFDEDWERAAKRKIRIDLVDPGTAHRKSIYELDSYVTIGPSAHDILKLGKPEEETEERAPRELPKIRYSVSMGTEGIARVNLSPLTQKIVGCVIGENVTTEYPWVWVEKEIIEDNLDLHSESSDFLAMKNEIVEYPEPKMLIGYAPSVTHEGQFYICLSTEAKETILQQIERQRREHENRVRSAVYKEAGTWIELGSSKEVDANVIKNHRALFEVELVSTADLLDVPMNLVDRQADDQRDGYIELLPYRQTFENVSRSMISRPTQVTPCTKDNEAQTAPSMPLNSWFQYRYEYKPIDLATFSEEDTESFKRFLRRYTHMMVDQVEVNATWDIYADDYKSLIRNERDTRAPIPIRYKEHQSFYDGKLIKQKIINDLSWHPLWTGIGCTAYTYHSKSEQFIGKKKYDEVLRDCKGDNVALIWSFNDCLTPKLILECPREVTSISICPFDGNVIIGGCTNGQVVIWSIPGRIESVEAIVVHTSAQVKYRVAMRTLMRWMRQTSGTTLVRPSAMSSLHHSQKGPITQIVWLPSYHKVEKNGRIQSLAADTKLDDLPWQFVTSSLDGTVAFWDLKEDIPSKRIHTDKKARPAALVESMSYYKAFDRVWRPYYLLLIQYPNESRRAMLNALTMCAPKLQKELDEQFPVLKPDITIRRYYKLIQKKPDYTMIPEMFVGTVEGYVGLITWQGFDMETPASREEAKWKWMKRLHDGPITHIVRSKYLRRIVATIGGRVFAVWQEDYGEPIIWKKSQLRYTGCTWGTFRPTILILARIDGTAEIWDFVVKSKEPVIMQSVSGRIITGIYTHELPLDPQCVGFCDYNGTLRVFTAPPSFLTFDRADIVWMQNFVDQQIDRLKEFKTWQDDWNRKNSEMVAEKIKLDKKEADQKRIEGEAKHREEVAETLRLAAEREKLSKKARKPWQFIEDVKQQWHAMEMKRMQITILEKKGLRREVLDRQRAPVLKIRQDARRRKEKIQEILQQREQIFDETVTFLFPEHQRMDRKYTIDRKQVVDSRRMSFSSIPTQISMGREGRKLSDEDEEEDDAMSQRMEDTEIIDNFLEIQAEALEKLKNQQFEREFDWRNVMKEGRFRRHSIDVALQNQRLNGQ